MILTVRIAVLTESYHLIQIGVHCCLCSEEARMPAGVLLRAESEKFAKALNYSFFNPSKKCVRPVVPRRLPRVNLFFGI